MNRQYFEAVRLERTVMFFLLFFIVVVAAFGIMNTLITVTVQKRREIGILKALGSRTMQIIWIFLAQGMVVGFFGNVIGVGAGLGLVHFRNGFSHWLTRTFGIEIFPASVYQFTEIPAELVTRDVALICISAFVICSVAALIPAFLAARLVSQATKDPDLDPQEFPVPSLHSRGLRFLSVPKRLRRGRRACNPGAVGAAASKCSPFFPAG